MVVVDPLNRQNGVARVEVELEGRRVVEARITNPNFRGLEVILRGRDPLDAPFLTQRICGICSTAHGTASSLAVEDAMGGLVPENGVLMRNLIYGADLLQNHARHFYLLSLPDWVKMPEHPPFTPHAARDLRFCARETERLLRNYERSITVGRQAHALVTVWGTRAPHQQAMVAGGVPTPVTADRLAKAASLLSDLRSFIEGALLPDTGLLAERYSDYYFIGGGPANLLSFGMFFKPGGGSSASGVPGAPGSAERYYPAGAVVDGRREELDLAAITEDVTYSWFNDAAPPRHPAEGVTAPVSDLSTGYTFTKAPRYRGHPMQGGPLARAWLNGDYNRGISTMDRIVTRAHESMRVAELMEGWLADLEPGEPGYEPVTRVESGAGVGLHDSMRGPLGHWVRIRGGRIDRYQVVTPSAWNLSPHDRENRRGPVEEALVGIEIADPDHPVEIGRVVRSFDPCSMCSVQMLEAPGAWRRQT